ncbi:MAG: hypothetical protein M3Q79_03610 [bacterium]|nr:hypothetical protein [bacterium]
MKERIKRILLALGLVAPMLAAVPVRAATTILVTPSDTQGWSTADTRLGGAVNFVADTGSPLPDEALNLTSDATTTSKAQYLHGANTPITEVINLSYSAKQNTASFADGTASYQLIVDLNGSTVGGFTTFVYEPYQNGGAVDPAVWETYNVDEGQFWSSQAVECSGDDIVAGGGGEPFYSLSAIQANCPEFVVIGYGVNIGSNNPSYNVNVDRFVFNDTTYDFELTAPADTAAPTTPVALGASTPVIPCGGTTDVFNVTLDWTDSTDNSGAVAGYNYFVVTPNLPGGFSTTTTNSEYSGAFNSGEGVYTYKVNAYDAAGNVSAWSNECSITYDDPSTLENKEECKQNGWKLSSRGFKNQGDCVSFFATNGRNQPANSTALRF